MFDQSLALGGELRGELGVEGEDEVPSEVGVLGEGHPLTRDQLAVPGAATQTLSQAPQPQRPYQPPPHPPLPAQPL